MMVDPMTKPIRVLVRLKNNRLVACREELGLTLKAAAERMGVSLVTLMSYECMKLSPLASTASKARKDRFWKKSAEKVAHFYGLSPEEMFPGVVQRVLKTQGQFEMDDQDVEALIGASFGGEPPELPDEVCERDELNRLMHKALLTLTTKEHLVIAHRFGMGGNEGGKTLDEVANVLQSTFGHSTSRERVHQIEAKALRKLRHPSRSNPLRAYVGRKEYKISADGRHFVLDD